MPSPSKADLDQSEYPIPSTTSNCGEEPDPASMRDDDDRYSEEGMIHANITLNPKITPEQFLAQRIHRAIIATAYVQSFGRLIANFAFTLAGNPTPRLQVMFVFSAALFSNLVYSELLQPFAIPAKKFFRTPELIKNTVGVATTALTSYIIGHQIGDEKCQSLLNTSQYSRIGLGAATFALIDTASTAISQVAQPKKNLLEVEPSPSNYSDWQRRLSTASNYALDFSNAFAIAEMIRMLIINSSQAAIISSPYFVLTLLAAYAVNKAWIYMSTKPSPIKSLAQKLARTESVIPTNTSTADLNDVTSETSYQSSEVEINFTSTQRNKAVAWPIFRYSLSAGIIMLANYFTLETSFTAAERNLDSDDSHAFGLRLALDLAKIAAFTLLTQIKKRHLTSCYTTLWNATPCAKAAENRKAIAKSIASTRTYNS